jgi:hypothetical protein
MGFLKKAKEELAVKKAEKYTPSEGDLPGLLVSG